jgi:hypothetical protein
LCALAVIVGAPTMDASIVSALLKGVNASIRRLKRGQPCQVRHV